MVFIIMNENEEYRGIYREIDEYLENPDKYIEDRETLYDYETKM